MAFVFRESLTTAGSRMKPLTTPDLEGGTFKLSGKSGIGKGLC